MKHIKRAWLVTITLFLLIGCVEKSTAELPKKFKQLNPEFEEHFKGNIKSYTEKHYFMAYKPADAEANDENLSSTEVVMFDKNNNPIKKTVYEERYTNWTIYEYNKKGDVIEKREFRGEEPTEDNIQTVTTYEYDEKGYKLLETKSTLYSTSIADKRNVFTYDFENREVKEQNFINGNTSYVYYIYKFDEKGLLKSFKKYSTATDSKSATYRYEYNEKGQLIKENFSDDFTGELLFTYNEQGYVTERDYVSSHLTSYEYKFDDRGNWIEKKMYELDKLISIYVREIEYY